MMNVFLWTDRTVHPISGKEHGDKWRCVAVDQTAADEQWALPGHGSWHKYYCGVHDCSSSQCAREHRCKGHHKGYVTYEGAFSCSREFNKGPKCGFKCQFDVSRLTKCEQNRFGQLTSSGGKFEIEVDSTESVGEDCGYLVSFHGRKVIYPLPKVIFRKRTTSGPGAKTSAT